MVPVREAVAFEWRYHTRQLSFVAGMAIFAFFGFVLTVGLGRGEVNANSPAQIVEVMALLSLVSIFPLTVFSASAILRDREHAMEEIVFTTAIAKNQFLLTRFGGVLLASLSLMLCATAGMLAAPLSGMVEVGRIGPTNPLHYLQAFGFIVVPNILFIATLVFAIAALTRSAPASYVGSVVVYVLYFVAAAFTNSPMMAASKSTAGTSMTISALLDPVGLSAFFEQIRYWTVAERNEMMVSLSGNLLANRILWTALSVVILAIVLRAYPFRLMQAARRQATRVDDAPPTNAAALRPVDPRPRRMQQLFSAASMELRLLIVNFPFLVLLLTWMAFIVPEIVGPVTSGEYGAPFLPMTSLVIARLAQPLSVLGTIAVIYWSAEAFWRERSVRFAPIVESTAVRGTTLFTAKLAALVAMLIVIAMLGMIVGIVIQFVRGGAQIEVTTYLGFIALGVTPLALFAAASGVIHVLSPNKYAGMMFTSILAALVHRGDLVGVEHPLLRFAYTPAISHSDMSGFGDVLPAFLWFSAYWALVVGTLGYCAGWMWRKHDDESLARRLRALFQRIPRAQLAALVAATLAVGAFVFFNTNVLNRYESTEETLDWKADYEKTWGPTAGEPQPEIVAIETRIDIDPDQRSLRVRGEYRLVNMTEKPIDRLIFSVRRDATRAMIAVDGAGPAAEDERFGMRTIPLSSPLAPGESVAARFDLAYQPRGFSESMPDMGVRTNGSFVMGFLTFPGTGYRTSYEIRDVEERTKRGLPERGHWSDSSIEQGGDAPHSEWITMDATISTTEGQTVVGPGRLVRAWNEDGRSLFHYRTDGRIPNVLAFASARYDVTRERYGGVDIEVYAHPGHTAAVPAILETARASLDVFQEAFGRYPHDVLRLAETPAGGRFGGFATPGMILLAENRVFYVDTTRDAPVDLVGRRVAHEIAHQWWGHWVVPATVEGGVVITESLTKYAETLVLERLRGPAQVRNLRAVELDRYLALRAGETEPSLWKTGSQPFLYYSKGLLVMTALRDLLGPEAVETALRRLVESESGPDGNATTTDLIEQLELVAPAESRPLIEEWMKQVVLHDLSIESAYATRLANGKTRVGVRVRATKVRFVDGRETPSPMDEMIGFAVFDDERTQLVAEARRIRSGANDLVFVLDVEPATVELDPEILRIDRNRLDNTWRLDGAR